MGSQSRIRVWKRLRIPGSQDWEHVDAERSCVYQHALAAQPARDKVDAQAHASRSLHDFSIRLGSVHPFGLLVLFQKA